MAAAVQGLCESVDEVVLCNLKVQHKRTKQYSTQGQHCACLWTSLELGFLSLLVAGCGELCAGC